MKPTRITVHTSASRRGSNLKVEDIRKHHVEVNGWSDIGYHFVIHEDGTIHNGRPLSRQGAGVRGHNEGNIHICLVGGLDEYGKPMEGDPVKIYSEQMLAQLFFTIFGLVWDYDIDWNEVKGHRDYSPDLNGDGEISSEEWIKLCPCFDVQEWLKACRIKWGVYE